MYSEYLEESSKSYFCASTLDKKQYFPVGGGKDGLKPHLFYKFDTLKECISWTNRNRNQFLIAVSFIFLIPNKNIRKLPNLLINNLIKFNLFIFF